MKRSQNPQQNISKLDIQKYKKNNALQQSGVYPGKQGWFDIQTQSNHGINRLKKEMWFS